MGHNDKKISFIINVIFVVTILLLIYFFFHYIFFYISPFIIAFFIAMMLEPSIVILTRKLHIKRNVSAVIAVIFVMLLAVLSISFISGTIIKEGKDLLQALPSYLDRLNVMFKNMPLRYERLLNNLPFKLSEWIKGIEIKTLLSGTLGNRIFAYATQFISSIPSLLIYIMVTIVSTFFTTISYPSVKSFIYSLMSNKSKSLTREIKVHLFSTLRYYGQAYTILILITFAELLISFYLFKIPHAITLAFFISIIDILPILGVGTILLPWSFIELIQKQPINALKIIGIYLFITVVRQIIEPKIIGDKVGLPPLVTLICIYVGLKFFGVIGMFLLPIIFTVIYQLYKNGSLSTKKDRI